jgi:hypothetical protein
VFEKVAEAFHSPSPLPFGFVFHQVNEEVEAVLATVEPGGTAGAVVVVVAGTVVVVVGGTVVVVVGGTVVVVVGGTVVVVVAGAAVVVVAGRVVVVAGVVVVVDPLGAAGGTWLRPMATDSYWPSADVSTEATANALTIATKPTRMPYSTIPAPRSLSAW